MKNDGQVRPNYRGPCGPQSQANVGQSWQNMARFDSAAIARCRGEARLREHLLGNSSATFEQHLECATFRDAWRTNVRRVSGNTISLPLSSYSRPPESKYKSSKGNPHNPGNTGDHTCGGERAARARQRHSTNCGPGAHGRPWTRNSRSSSSTPSSSLFARFPKTLQPRNLSANWLLPAPPCTRIAGGGEREMPIGALGR